MMVVTTYCFECGSLFEVEVTTTTPPVAGICPNCDDGPEPDVVVEGKE